MVHNLDFYHLKGHLSVRQEYISPQMDTIYSWVKRVSKTSLFEYNDIYLCGSMLQNVNYPSDVDIIVNGGNTFPNYIFVDMLEVLDIAMNEFRLNMDMLYCPDISFMDLPVEKKYQKEYKAYTCYDYEMMWVGHTLIRNRSFRQNPKWGLLTEHQYIQPSSKSIERNYPKWEVLKLNV